jgi:hypothetical protein
MSRKNKKSYKHPDYIAIYRHTFKSAAWQALSVGARATYLELTSNYNTKRMNAVYLAARTGAKRLGAGKNTITKWLRELQHYGLIVLVQGGSLGVRGYALAQKFRLTDRPYGDTRATYDFQNWTGELFDPAKHMMSEADKERRKRERPKQNPVPTAGTPRPYGRDIEKTGTLSSLCPYGRDIETAPDRPYGGDITSLTSCRGKRGPDEEPIKLTALMEWAPPTLTKIKSTDELRRLYRCEMMEDASEEHLRDGDANAPIPARDAQSYTKPTSRR